MTCKLTKEIRDDMSKQKTYSLATASKSGIPNVVPIGLLFARDDENVWIVDNFMKKTLSNLRENPQAAFFVWNPESKESYQVKGTVSIEDSGKDYEEARSIAHSRKETLPAKNLLKFRVKDIFYVSPGPKAGERMDQSS